MGWAGYEWFHLILRWFHVMAGISWIGSSLYFLYLARLSQRSEPEVVRAAGGVDNAVLWFRRETALTWLSGVLLLLIVYFGIDTGGVLRASVSVALLAVAWFVYDRLWQGRPALAVAASAALLVLLIWALGLFYGGRLLYLQLGAVLGTLMAGNVWFRIVPALAAREQDGAWRLARERSAHNNYLIFPVVALMLSNHVPGIYGTELAPVILVLLMAAFALAREIVVGKRFRALAVGGVIALLAAMIVMTAA
jgi:uncharacterized membrane protein